MVDGTSTDLIGIWKFEFSKMRSTAERTMERLSDEEFQYRDSPDENSVKIIVQHMTGNLLSRFTDFLSADGEKSWRNRDQEFEEQEISRIDLMKKWGDAWTVLFDVLDHLNQEQLPATIFIRKEPLSVVQAMTRQLIHYSYHIGQIVQLAKKIKGDQWESLTIPKGRSAEFLDKGKYLKG